MSFLDTAKRAFVGRADDYEDYDERYDNDYDDEYEEEPRRSLFSFLKRDNNDEDYEESYEREPYKSQSYSSRTTKERFTNTAKQTPTFTRSTMAGVEVIVHYPTSLDDATRIIREVKGNKITMFDISSIQTDEEARRVVDYIGGAAFGMECPFERLCPSIFCIAPTGVKFDIKKRY